MTSRRFGGVGVRKAPAPPKRAAPVKRLSTAWPPAEFSVQATLVQPACVKCRRNSYKLHRLKFRGEVLWPEDCASVCDECWCLVMDHYANNRGNLESAFWAAKPSTPAADAVLIDLINFKPLKGMAGPWRQFREDRRRKRRFKRTN